MIDLGVIRILTKLTARAESKFQSMTIFWVGCVASLLVTSMFPSSIALRAEPLDGGVQVMTPFFAKALPAEPSSESGWKGAVLADVLRSGTGPTVLLVSDGDRTSLLVGADRNGFGTSIPLTIHAYGLHLSSDANDAFWIGGYSKPHYGVSGRQTFAYISKVDRQGKLIWQHEFGGQTERRIQSIAPLLSGGGVVSATDGGETWLAKISGSGDLVWERHVGLGKGSAVAIAGDNIVLAGIEANWDVQGYREDVSVWSFGQDGEELGHWVVRQGINRVARQYAEDVEIAQGDGGLYIISKWGTFVPFKPLQVAKFDLRTGVSWHKELPITVNGEGSSAHICTLAIAALSNGDLLVACRTGADKIVMLRLNAADGNLTKSTIRFSTLPSNCDEPWSPASLMLEKSHGAVWLFGSPRVTDSKPCGWIAEISPPPISQ